MAEKLYIWSTNRANNPNACQYYRITVPNSQIQKLGYGYFFEDTGGNEKQGLEAMFTSDVCQFYSIGGEGALHQLETVKAMKPGVIPSGEKVYPPVVVYDVDDNTDYVHPMNPTYAYLGIRDYPQGRLLNPGDDIKFENSEGERQLLWWEKDETREAMCGSNGIPFDITRNLQQTKVRHQIIRTAHGATVSTPHLASYFKEVIGQPNVHVFPNTITPEDYEDFDVVRTDDNVRIFWQGSLSHYIDWYPLKDAIKTIDQKYKNITWVIYGSKFDWLYDIIAPEKIEFYPWSHYQSYKLRRGLLNIDINLCPLANNEFNRCKSAIKWYEASVWKKPEATLAADVAPYQEIKEGKTGLLYKNNQEFVEKLSLLIENQNLRRLVAEGAHKWVFNNRLPEHTIPPLVEFYQELKDRQKRELSPKIVIAKR